MDGVWGRLPSGRAGAILVFDDGSQGATWLGELTQHGFSTLATSDDWEARHLLASGKFSVAVIGGNATSWLPARQWSGYRVKFIFVSPRISAQTVLDLSKQAALVLPGPLEPGVLARAIEVVIRTDDQVKTFSREYKLSPRETALLHLASSGMNNDEAASELGCSRATISTFWNRIFRKTGVSGQRDVFILLLKRHGGTLSTAL